MKDEWISLALHHHAFHFSGLKGDFRMLKTDFMQEKNDSFETLKRTN